MHRNCIILLVCQIVLAVLLLSSPAHPYSCGDVNGDGHLNLGDWVWIMKYCFQIWPEPVCGLDTADVDSCQSLNIRDAVYLSNYVFGMGTSPSCPPTQPEYQPDLEPNDTINLPSATLSAEDSLVSVSVSIWYKNSESIRGFALPLRARVGAQIPYIDSLVWGARILPAAFYFFTIV